MELNTKNLSEVPKNTNALLADGIYFVKIKAMSPKVTKKNKQMLDIQLVPAGAIGHSPDVLPLRDGGEQKNNGRLIFDSIFMEKTENWDPDVKVAEIARAVKFSGERVTISDLVGQWVKIKLGYRAAKDEYDESNTVKAYYPIEDSDEFNPPA